VAIKKRIHRPKETRVKLAVLAIAALIAIAIIGGTLAYIAFPRTGTNSSHADSSSTTTLTDSSSTATLTQTSSMFTSLGASSTNSSLGLILTLGISATQLYQGQAIKVTLDLNNTLASANNVPSRFNWPFPSLPNESEWTAGCPGASDSFLLYRGYYVSSNVSSATPVYTGDPGFDHPCPAGAQSTYPFLPMSDRYLDCPTDKGSCGPNPVSAGWAPETFDGIYNYTSGHLCTQPGQACGPGYAKICEYDQECNQSLFIPFPDGVYTVVAGDEWGQLAILHF
jgi:hypothetical protein